MPQSPSPPPDDVHQAHVTCGEADADGAQREVLAVYCPDTKALSAIIITDSMR